MKRIILVAGTAAMVLGSGAALAAGAGTVAVGATQAVSTTTCDKLATGVNLQVSKNTVGAWDCTLDYIGVGTGSTAGAKKTYKGSSAGGKIAESTACGAAACTTGEAAAVALLGSGGS